VEVFDNFIDLFMTAKKQSASPSNPQADALVERIYKEIQDRKGQLAKDVSQKGEEPASLIQAGNALERIKTKEKRVRKWPKILRPVRRDQQTVNDCLLNAIENVISEVSQFRKTLANLYPQNRETSNRPMAVIDKRINHLEGKIGHFDAALQLIVARLQRSGELSPELRKGEGADSAATVSLFDELQDLRVDAFYLDFEDKFRGSREMIKERLLEFTSHLCALKERVEDATAVDVGCGRGEWLEVLKENGIAARGVDMNARMAMQCHAYGLDAECGDGIAYLQNLPSDSLALVSGFHIVEHLTLSQLLELFYQSLRVLRPGGMAIFETPNPECLKVSSYTFYLDPTHRNPIPPELLSFIGTHTGFREANIERLHLYKEEGIYKGYGDYVGIFVK